MSMHYEQEGFLTETLNDFSGFLREKNWPDARALIENLEDLGYENLSWELRRDMNKAMAKPSILETQMDVITNGLRV